MTRAVMWCRRNKALASLAALLMLALVGGLAGVTWKWREADHERSKAEAVNELLTQRLLAQASLEHRSARQEPDRPRATRPRRLAARRLARGPARDRGQDPRDDRRRVSFARRSTTGRKTHLRAAVDLATQLDGTVDASRHAAGHQSSGHAARPDEPAAPMPSRSCVATWTIAATSLAATTRSRSTRPNAWALSSGTWARVDEAETILRENVDDRSRVLDAEHPDTLRSTYLLSRVLRDRRKFADAEHFAYTVCT